MDNTTLTGTEIAKVSAVFTGGGYKRSSSKDKAIARLKSTMTEAVGAAITATYLPDILGAPDLATAEDWGRTALEKAAPDKDDPLDYGPRGVANAMQAAEDAVNAPTIPQEGGEEDRKEHPTKAARSGTKQAELISMLETEQGASINEIVDRTGWLPHTVRGAIAGTLKKKLGLTVLSERHETRGRVYRIPSS